MDLLIFLVGMLMSLYICRDVDVGVVWALLVLGGREYRLGFVIGLEDRPNKPC